MAKKQVKEAPEDGADGAEDGEGAPAKKKLPLKLLIIGGVAALVVLGGGGAAAFMFLKPKPAAEGEHAEAKAKPEKKGKEGDHAEAPASPAVIRPGPEGVVFYTLPDIVVNMQTAEGKATFLKLKLTLELPDGAVTQQLDPNLPR
ncbi:flagellar basal body protein FliL, partial [Phenylobacterium sp.]